MYDDPRYDARQHVTVPNAIQGTNTATASLGVEGATDLAKFEFFKRVKLLGMKCAVDTISSKNQIGDSIKLMNGTNQLGDIALLTGTNQASAGDVCDGTMTAAQCTLDPNTELQVDFVGTATDASVVQTVGPLSLSLSYQEMFVGS